MQNHILYFGHSHANNFKNAIQGGNSTDPDRFTYRAVAVGNSAFIGGMALRNIKGQIIANPMISSALNQSLKREGRRTWLCSISHGNFANVLSLLESDEPFDFILPGAFDLPLKNNARIIPYDLVFEKFRKDMQHMATGFEALARLPAHGVLHVGPAAPLHDSKYVKSLLSAATISGAAKRGIQPEDIVISAPYVRYKAWLAECRVVEQLCAEYGITYVATPSRSLDSNGFRLPELAADAIHGNTDFGALVVANVEEAINQLGENVQ